MKDIHHILKTASAQLGIDLGTEELGLFREFYRELLLWNSKMSLVSVKTPLDIPVKHFIDSLMVVPCINDNVESLLDIGTGAGFPGIPIKIVKQSLALCLVDSSRKKTSFLKTVVGKLRLHNTSVVNTRIQQLANDASFRGTFDIVISRASFKLAPLIEIGSAFLAPSGTIIAMKGPHVDNEMRSLKAVSDRTGVHCTEVRDVELPITGNKRKILLFKKQSSVSKNNL
jgi:16S rRNA (guanine527-N7)-methyltransferase